jgi:hypothetical protein
VKVRGRGGGKDEWVGEYVTGEGRWMGMGRKWGGMRISGDRLDKGRWV